MALSFTNSPPKYLYFEGRKIRIKPYIRNVLFCLEVLNDSVLSNADKMDLCIKVLVSHWHSCIPKKEKLLEEIFKFLQGDSQKEERQKVFDFEQDAALIYAGFLQAYGIDLHKRKWRRMHWHTFMALFSGLPEETRIMQIISIRAKPLPKPTKYNAEERQQLMRLNAIYSLEISEEERERQLATGLWKLAEMLQSMAKKGRE